MGWGGWDPRAGCRASRTGACQAHRRCSGTGRPAGPRDAVPATRSCGSSSLPGRTPSCAWSRGARWPSSAASRSSASWRRPRPLRGPPPWSRAPARPRRPLPATRVDSRGAGGSVALRGRRVPAEPGRRRPRRRRGPGPRACPSPFRSLRGTRAAAPAGAPPPPPGARSPRAGQRRRSCAGGRDCLGDLRPPAGDAAAEGSPRCPGTPGGLFRGASFTKKGPQPSSAAD